MLTKEALFDIIQFGIDKGQNTATRLTKRENYAYGIILSCVMKYESISISLKIHDFKSSEDDNTRYRNVLSKLVEKGYIHIDPHSDSDPLRKIKLNLQSISDNIETIETKHTEPKENKVQQFTPVTEDTKQVILTTEVQEAIQKTIKYCKINGIDVSQKQKLFVDTIITSFNEHKKFIGEIKLSQIFLQRNENEDELSENQVTQLDDYFYKKEMDVKLKPIKTELKQKYNLALKQNYNDYKKTDTSPFTLTEMEWDKYHKFAKEYTNPDNGFEALILKAGNFWNITSKQWKQNQLSQFDTNILISLVWEVQKWIEEMSQKGTTVSKSFPGLLKIFAERNVKPKSATTETSGIAVRIDKNNNLIPWTKCVVCNKDNKSRDPKDTSPPDACDSCTDSIRESNKTFKDATKGIKGTRNWSKILVNLINEEKVTI
jgi:hypothetical protein